MSRNIPAAVFSLTIAFAAPGAAQQPPIVQPGAPGHPGRTVQPEEARDRSRVAYTDADVKFMQGMIHHHAQAVEMVDLLKARTRSEQMKKLGERIALSQADEIRMMRRWLEIRGQAVPAGHAMHMQSVMPGMLTQAEMQLLAAAKDTEFDRLFLEGMIRHHAGALTMVKDLFATPGAAQESDIFAFASDVEADQTAEIGRMSAMLKELRK